MKVKVHGKDLSVNPDTRKVDIDVPTKLSDLINDKGFVTEEESKNSILNTASGENISLTDGSDNKLPEFGLYGNMKQYTTTGKNFYDVLETKYYILALNNVECNRKDIKKYYNELLPTITPETKSKMELELLDNNKENCAFYFEETFILSSNNKYKGKILFGDKKNEDCRSGNSTKMSHPYPSGSIDTSGM